MMRFALLLFAIAVFLTACFSFGKVMSPPIPGAKPVVLKSPKDAAASAGVVRMAVAPPPKSITNRLSASWNAVTGAMKGYWVHWGTNSRSYSNHVWVGNVTNAAITITRTRGQYTYFALTVVANTALQSDFSLEARHPGTNGPPSTNVILSWIAPSAVVLSSVNPAAPRPWPVFTNASGSNVILPSRESKRFFALQSGKPLAIKAWP